MVSERSFQDRYGRALSLKEALELIPGYSPSDEMISLGKFNALLDEIADMNNGIGVLKDEYTRAVTERRLLFFDTQGIKKRASAILNYCKSVSSIKTSMPSIQKMVKKINNQQKPKNSAAPAPEGEGKKRNTGEQSYAELTQFMYDLNEMLKTLGDAYSPNNPLITTDNLTAYINSLKLKNEASAESDFKYSKAIKERTALYEGDNGLREKMAAIRAYMRGDFGANSPEYLAIRELKY